MSDSPTNPELPSQNSETSSWPSKETNSVNASSCSFREVEDRVVERVAEFETHYPDLADLPLSVTDGRKLRRVVTDPEFTEEWVDPEDEFKNAFSVQSLDRREAATWSDAIHAFLRSHTDYDGLVARFVERESGDEFDVPLVDAWGEEYSRTQYARARALQRQMGGGERPTGGEAIPAWDNPATAMLTLTASSTPDGDRLSPVDHLDAIHDAFSYDGVRDTLRNVMEYHLGIDADAWGYWLQAEPHGMGVAASDDDSPGANACYTHLHVGVYFDLSATVADLPSVGSELERVIDKHVEVCDPAGPGGHTYSDIGDYLHEDDGCISLNSDVQNLGSYIASYMGGYTENLLDKPIEYLAWGALYWSAARRRTSRSKLVNESIRADRCHQRNESETANQSNPHAKCVRWNEGRGPDVVCSYCDSGWNVDQSRLKEPPTDVDHPDTQPDELEWDGPPGNLAERWPTADAAALWGESHRDTVIRERVLTYLDVHGSDVSVPSLMGRLNIDPARRTFVEEIVEGSVETPSESFDRNLDDSGYELKALVEEDGTEHIPGGSGVDMVALELPEQRLQEESRLKYVLHSGEIFRCGICEFGTHNSEIMSSHLLNHGVDRPLHAEYVLIVEDYHNRNRSCMEREIDSPVVSSD